MVRVYVTVPVAAPLAWASAAREDFAACEAATACVAVECVAVTREAAAECDAAGWLVAREADRAPPDGALEPEEEPEPVDVEPGRWSAKNHTSANSATAARTAWKGRDN